MPLAEMKKLLEHTGYKEPYDDTPLELGKWFTYGESRREFPDFVSSFSFASETPSTEGWKPDKKDYPDFWINPEDSLVLTLNAGEIVPSTAFPSRITLRFPRITALRPDKRAREVESLQNLWETHDNVLADRAGDNSEGAFKSGSASLTDTQGLKERFWTEEKYSAAGKNRRKKGPKTLHAVSAAGGKVPIQSLALKGVTFVPMEGAYRLIKNSLDAAEAQEEGWLDVARRVKDHGSFRALIQKHGGKAMLTPDAKLLEDGAIIIGGDKNDPRVVNLIEMIEKAKSKAPELRMKKKPTTGDQSTLVFAECKGVVRWTFLLSALSKWQASQDGKGENKKILDSQPDLLAPDPLDYLARPKSLEGDVVEELCRVHVQDTTKMRRLLHELAESTSEDASVDDASGLEKMSWRETCKKSLDPNERWIMRCSKQTLWPYQEGRAIIQETAVYPDVFADPRASTNDLSSVDPYDHAALLSVLPLLRVSGATIETKLGGRVTHILCALRGDLSKVAYEKAKPENFIDPERGERLREDIKKSPLFPDDSLPDFVSPAWVRDEVWKAPPGPA